MTTKKTTASAAFAAFARLFKAVPEETMIDLMDQWSEPDGEHKNPGRGEIGTGPAERMSGDGAVKMVSEYSRVAPQQGLTDQYQEFQRMLDGWGKSFSIQLLAVLERGLTKASAAAPSADTFLGKGVLKLAKAKTSLRKADLSDDEDEKEERKAHLAAAAEALKSAKRLLRKASEEMEDTEDDDELDKARGTLRALTDRLAKAERTDKDDKGEHEDEDKDKDAEKAKAIADVQKAVDGLAVLPATIAGVMNTIMGRSRNPVPPDMNAAAMSKGQTPRDRLLAAIDAGDLTGDEELRAMTLLQQMAVAGRPAAPGVGEVVMKNLEQDLSNAPSNIRRLIGT